MVFGVSRPKRLSVVGVEELGEARQKLDRRDVGGFGDGVRRRAHPLSEAGERAPDAVRNGVCRSPPLSYTATPLPPVAAYTALTIFSTSSFSPLKPGERDDKSFSASGTVLRPPGRLYRHAVRGVSPPNRNLLGSALKRCCPAVRQNTAQRFDNPLGSVSMICWAVFR